MANHFSILAWRIPWAEEPGGLQSMGSQAWWICRGPLLAVVSAAAVRGPARLALCLDLPWASGPILPLAGAVTPTASLLQAPGSPWMRALPLPAPLPGPQRYF